MILIPFWQESVLLHVSTEIPRKLSHIPGMLKTTCPRYRYFPVLDRWCDHFLHKLINYTSWLPNQIYTYIFLYNIYICIYILICVYLNLYLQSYNLVYACLCYVPEQGFPKQSSFPSVKICRSQWSMIFDAFQTRSCQHHRKHRLENEHGGTTCRLNLSEPNPPEKRRGWCAMSIFTYVYECRCR